ncbi:MAG: hypothetical protein SFU91_00660 [Chloroherpetonaceae bacterium]|nr:hypothetical protein [Chloroherpetonaceae bacterium]
MKKTIHRFAISSQSENGATKSYYLDVLEYEKQGTGDVFYFYPEPSGILPVIPNLSFVRLNESSREPEFSSISLEFTEEFPSDVVFSKPDNDFFISFQQGEIGLPVVPIFMGIIQVPELVQQKRFIPYNFQRLNSTSTPSAPENCSSKFSLKTLTAVHISCVLKALPVVDNQTLDFLIYTSSPLNPPVTGREKVNSNGLGFIDFVLNELEVFQRNVTDKWIIYASFRRIATILELFAKYLNQFFSAYGIIFTPSQTTLFQGIHQIGFLEINPSSYNPSQDMTVSFNRRDLIEAFIDMRVFVLSDLFGQGNAFMDSERQRGSSVQPTRGLRSKDGIYPDKDLEYPFSFLQEETVMDVLMKLCDAVGVKPFIEFVGTDQNKGFFRITYQRFQHDGKRYSYNGTAFTLFDDLKKQTSSLLDSKNQLDFELVEEEPYTLRNERLNAKKIEVKEIFGAGDEQGEEQPDAYTKKRVYLSRDRNPLFESVSSEEFSLEQSIILASKRRDGFTFEDLTLPFTESVGNVARTEYAFNRLFYRTSDTTVFNYPFRFFSHVGNDCFVSSSLADCLLFYHLKIGLSIENRFENLKVVSQNPVTFYNSLISFQSDLIEGVSSLYLPLRIDVDDLENSISSDFTPAILPVQTYGAILSVRFLQPHTKNPLFWKDGSVSINLEQSALNENPYQLVWNASGSCTISLYIYDQDYNRVYLQGTYDGVSRLIKNVSVLNLSSSMNATRLNELRAIINVQWNKTVYVELQHGNGIDQISLDVVAYYGTPAALQSPGWFFVGQSCGINGNQLHTVHYYVSAVLFNNSDSDPIGPVTTVAELFNAISQSKASEGSNSTLRHFQQVIVSYNSLECQLNYPFE